MKIKISKIQHIGIPVTNLAQSVKFYESLGFDTVMRSNFIHEKEQGEVKMMQSGDIVMELYQLPEKCLGEIRNRGNGHIDHIAFDVADVNAVFEELKSQNFNIIEAAPVFLSFWKKGCSYFNILGPDGERLEFNQIFN